MSACGVCGVPCPPPFRAPPPLTAPDLDGRPGEPTRSTLHQWIAVCRNCRAAAPDLAALRPELAELVHAAPYRALRSPFLRWAMLCEAAGDRASEAEAVLQAAWAAEDSGADGAELRRRAAALWQGDPLRRVDVLRRAGALAEAASAASTIDARDPETSRIIAFQQERIEAGDTGRYLISSALRPPAATPHASHGRTQRIGLLNRLFGR